MDEHLAASVTAPAFGDGARGDVPPVRVSPASGVLRSLAGFGGDVVLLALVVFGLPFVLLLLGMPIAVLLWALLEGLKRLF